MYSSRVMSSTTKHFFSASCLALTIICLTFVLKKWHFGLRDHLGETDLSPERSTLLQQIRERQLEIAPLYVTSSEMSKQTTFSRDDAERNNISEDAWTSGSDIGCSELRGMTVVDFLGAGYTKTVLKAVLPHGMEVALKTVNDQGTDMRSCMEDFRDPKGCQDLVSFKLRKEIILLHRLQHPNIVKLKGQCQDSSLVGGITAVLEQGTPVQMIQLLQNPWEERFRGCQILRLQPVTVIGKKRPNKAKSFLIGGSGNCVGGTIKQGKRVMFGMGSRDPYGMKFVQGENEVCLGLVRLLHYLSLSPLGSVALLDFQPRQFVMVSGELKLTDLDDAIVTEPVCQTSSDCVLQFPLRNFTFPCASNGVCQGLNEMRNLYNAYRYFFIYLLPHQAPTILRPLVDQIMNVTGELKHGANKTLEAFEEVLRLYKSGVHLQNIPLSVIKDYTELKAMDTAGNVEYRCWPSYNQQGCMLSVHSATEAAFICNSHPQCTSFSLTGQKTWTGQLLASFRSGFSHVVPDVSSSAYVRKAKTSAATL